MLLSLSEGSYIGHKSETPLKGLAVKKKFLAHTEAQKLNSELSAFVLLVPFVAD